jgi:hypothetical protein
MIPYLSRSASLLLWGIGIGIWGWDGLVRGSPWLGIAFIVCAYFSVLTLDRILWRKEEVEAPPVQFPEEK